MRLARNFNPLLTGHLKKQPKPYVFFQTSPISRPVPAIHWIEERWLEFLLVVFDAPNRPDPGLLERWLIEVEHWPFEVANDLAIEYEFGMALLEKHVGQP